MTQNCKVFRARFVLPIDQPPIHDGRVVVSDGIIRQVEAWSPKQLDDTSSGSLIDLGDVALMPALVNAHTHLEFSHLQQPLGYPGIEFTRWIRLVVEARNQRFASAPSTTDTSESAHSQIPLQARQRTTTRVSKQNSILRGLGESYRSGIGCLGEIATDPVSLSNYLCKSTQAGLEIAVFLEQLGRRTDLLVQRAEELNQFLSEQTRPHLKLGVSPHAPYSVHPNLLQQMIQAAASNGVPVAMHLAESEAELELMTKQTGPFVELLNEFGIWDPTSFQPAQSMMDILQRLVRCPRTLIVHGNYLAEKEIEFIGQLRDKMAVVYCPRTHDYFGHSPYPLDQMRKAGVVLAIGTDSRASSPDLNLFAELRTLRQKYSRLSSSEILEMGSLNGARALGMADRLGSLSSGKSARMISLEHPDSRSTHLDWVLDELTNCQNVY